MAANARAERLLGVEADSLVYHTYFITDQFTYNLSFWMRLPVWRSFFSFMVFIWACLKYQRFHFYFDRGLLPPQGPFRFNRDELEVLSRLGKEIFFWTYGADVRTKGKTKALGKYHCCLECEAPGISCVCDDAAGERNVAEISRLATGVFAMGDMQEYTPGSRNDLFFWPLDLDAENRRKYAPHYPDINSERPVRVVHAPNHRFFKGTRFLIEAVERLRSGGRPVELVLVERVPNDQALMIYQSADVVFDQCLIGFHGFFALEAMAMGKPVMCYIRKPEVYLLHHDECPIVNVRADQVEDALRNLVENRALLFDLGIKGRKYIEKYFTLQSFANRLQRAYRELGGGEY